MKKFKLQKGFTLIELLIVITIIATLSVTVFVALNPVQRLKDAKDARRTADVDTILTAIHAAIVDNGGQLPSNMPPANTEQLIGTTTGTCTLANPPSKCVTGATCASLMTGAINLTKYLKTMPIDPIGSGTNNGGPYDINKTGYSVMVDSNGIVTVKACGTEGATLIQASR